MSLTFLYGNSGNGKSEYMYQIIADMAEHAPYQHYFVVVPEQFTMSAQRSLVDHTPSGVILNIDVVSFDRLAYRVFDELGVHRTVMGETGKSLLLRRIVEQNESDLTILRNNLSKMGYIGELKSVLSELMQYGISPDDLEEFLEQYPEETSLCYKIHDILSIYRSFDDYLREGYVTAERVLDLFADVAARSGILRDAVLFFDGFTGFTPVQMNLVKNLMQVAADIYVTVTMDVEESAYAHAQMEDLFYMSHRMINALTDAARETGFEVADPVRIEAGQHSRFADNPVLSHLEQNLFRVPSGTYEDPCADHIRICSLLTEREELRFAAGEIRTLVRDKNYRFRDCAIVCGNVGEYEKYADEVFSLYDIPVFVDMKQSILYHPLSEMIRSVCEMAQTNLSYESVFRFLKTGLCGFSADEVDELENYCLEKGIRGAGKWRERFSSPSSQHGRIRADEEKLQEDLERINSLRERFYTLTEGTLAAFKKKDATVLERTEALYRLLCSLSVEEQLRADAERFESSGDELSAQINRQIYKIVIDLLDKMVDLLGDQVVSVSDYTDILDAGFAAAKVGAIPPGNDCVILGDIERTRLDNVKVLFFLGVNDGTIPKKADRQSILSQYDREVLEAHHMELAPGEREEMFLQRFYLYLALTKPEDALCLTFMRMDGEGNAVRPSYLIGVLEKMFTSLHTEEIEAQDMLPLVTAKSSVESYLTGLIASDDHEPEPRWAALHRWYLGSDLWAERIADLFDAHFSVYKSGNLDPALAQSIYGTTLYNSVTRLERFEECEFAHFLEYGLKLAERPESSFESSDMGTMFHTILEKYGRLLEERTSWQDVTEEQCDEMLREVMEEAVLENPNDYLADSASNAYVLERIYRIMRRSIWAITEQIRRGDFTPEEYEMDFPEESGEGDRMRLTGRVDRMDTCVDDDSVHVRVIDYKSSGTSLNLANVYYGRQLQLPVYLDTAMNILRERYPDREIKPAGIFYFHVDDPLVDNTGDEEENEKTILKKLRPSGLVNSDPSVFLRMDRELEQPDKTTSEVLPISLNKDGRVSGYSKNVIPAQDFDNLIGYVRNVVSDVSHRILDGEIEINPYRMDKKTGCKYCRFAGICGFDFKIPGYDFREETKFSPEEVRDLIREQQEDT